MFPRHSVWPCLHCTPSSSSVALRERGQVSVGMQFCGSFAANIHRTCSGNMVDGREARMLRTHFPMNDSRKSILSDTLAIVGTTSFCRQSRASGHLDLFCDPSSECGR